MITHETWQTILVFTLLFELGNRLGNNNDDDQLNKASLKEEEEEGEEHLPERE